MRLVVRAAFLGVFVAACGHSAPDVLLAGEEPVPANHTLVVAELFTSEGCFSCPPADDFLSQLVQQQPIANVEVLGLGEHVDYWDRLGWRDPFSSAVFSDRQSEYATQNFHTRSIYTPQLVVDGRFQEVGSDRDAVRRAIVKAAQLPKAALTIAAALPDDAHAARVTVQVDFPPTIARSEIADVIVALAEDHLVTDVQRGENSGRTLKHSAVTRTLMVVGTLGLQDHMWATTASIPLAPAWKTSNLRVIGFVQQRRSRHIIGAGSISVDPH